MLVFRTAHQHDMLAKGNFWAMKHHLLTDEAQEPFVRIDRKDIVKMRDGEKQNGYIRDAYLVLAHI